MSLSPPAPVRPRASSTTLRPALTLQSLGRRRSNSNLQQQQQQNQDQDQSALQVDQTTPVPLTESPFVDDEKRSPETYTIQDSSEPSNMIAFVASRFLQWLHLQPKHHHHHNPSHDLDDHPILPLSASASKTTFELNFSEKQRSSAADQKQSWRTPSVHGPILIVITLIPLTTGLVLFSLNTLPISFSWPRTLSDLAQLGNDLQAYSQSGDWQMWHVIAVMSMTAIWKHAWSFPGSVIWNVLAGALFSPVFATLLLTFLTMLGSVCATLLSKPMSPFFSSMMPKALDMTRSALEGSSSPSSSSGLITPTLSRTPSAYDNMEFPGTPSKSYFKPGPPPLAATPNKTPAWVRLSILRLIGVVPWSGINIASGVCGVPIKDCMAGALIGSLPWTAVTCQIGDILQTVASTPSLSSGETSISSLLLTPANISKLVVLSVLSLAPILARNRLQSMLGSHVSSEPSHFPAEEESLPSPSTAPSTPREERRSSWFWNRERAEQRERERRRESRERELAELVKEKRGLDMMLPS